MGHAFCYYVYRSYCDTRRKNTLRKHRDQALGETGTSGALRTLYRQGEIFLYNFDRFQAKSNVIKYILFLDMF